jgi:hypothetical protein
MKHIVMFSGGLGSWMTAKRVAEKHGTDNLFLVFADVGGQHTSPHAGEDEDTYRFIVEAAADVFGVGYQSVDSREDFIAFNLPKLVWLNEGRDIWQVFTDNRFLGNSRLANCSKFLKQQPCREWLDANCDPADTTVYVGIDWTESHRLPAIVNAYLPYKAEAPLTEAPYLDKEDVKAACIAAGMEIPRLYRAGFPHNNCGGFCVRAGQAQMELLLREHPDRYAYHEGKEQELREHLDKDVAILRDRTGGNSVPLTLRRFRERVQMQPELFDDIDWGGCGCFVDEPAADVDKTA